MRTTLTTERIRATFTYPFKDPEGIKKLLISSLVILTSIFFLPITILTYGYIAQAMKRIILKGEPPSLPSWDTWELFLKDGLKLFGANFLYTAPGSGILLASVVVPIPCVLLQMLATEEIPLLDLLTLLSIIAQVLGFTIGLTLTSIAGFFLAPAQCHVIATGWFAAAFEFKGWWPILKAALGDFCIAYLLSAILGVLVVIVTQLFYIPMMVCSLWIFLLPPLSAYMMMVSQALIAQAYRAGVQKIAD